MYNYISDLWKGKKNGCLRAYWNKLKYHLNKNV